LQQLARVGHLDYGLLKDGMIQGTTLQLRQVLQHRIAQLSPYGRAVLEFVCLAAQPLSATVLLAAAESGTSGERPETIIRLIRERFVRSVSAEAGRRFEPAHEFEQPSPTRYPKR